MSAWTRALRCTDHRVIAKRYLWTGFAALALGGVLAMLIRWQWAYPGQPVPLVGRWLLGGNGAITPASYARIFTTHGLLMIFWAITPLLIQTFGTLLVPLQIGARELAFPKVTALGYALFVSSLGMVVVSFFLPLGTASAGWTSYPPLSASVAAPGFGETLVLLALVLNGLSTLLGAVNLIATVVRERAPGMHWLRLPLTTWGLFLTSVLNLLFVPVVAVATALLLMDRCAGTQFFVAGAAAVNGGGDPLLYQHLFWIFAHPEVYILILPVWGMVGDVLAFFARKPAHWYRGTVLSLVAITTLSGMVYAHHMFVAGIAPLVGKAFMLTTLTISIPSQILVFNWLFTLWRGSIRLATPMLFALGALFVFSVGGLTGLYLGALATDLYLHDTLWVVGHFHLIMAAATFLGAFCAVYFWAPLLFGRRLDERLGRIHFACSAILLTLVFGGQLVAGYAGQPRRLFDPYHYAYLARLLPLNRWTSLLAFALFASQLVFVWNVWRTLRAEPETEPNPWKVGTLEWTHRSDAAPRVLRGPHAFAAVLLEAELGRDFLGQAEALPPGVDEP